MLQFVVDGATCTRCGQCARDCPAEIIVQAGANPPVILPAEESNCIQCQHCLAVCPAAAISILGHDPADSIALDSGSFPPLDKMVNLIRGRRSVRRYQNENVNPQLLQRLLAALGNAPSGVNRMALTFSVIDDKVAMQRFRTRALDALAMAGREGRVPEAYAFLLEAIPLWSERKEDMIFRGAPHLLAVAAGPNAACPQEDVTLALAYFELMAQCAGLGTVWCGLAKMLLELLPELKETLGIAPGRAYYIMLFGPPAVHYQRTVQRDKASQVRRMQA
jgi:nitroreductase/NAD-dependent dihydropyrimidine dehydrogenase PreA subunit